MKRGGSSRDLQPPVGCRGLWEVRTREWLSGEIEAVSFQCPEICFVPPSNSVVFLVRGSWLVRPDLLLFVLRVVRAAQATQRAVGRP